MATLVNSDLKINVKRVKIRHIGVRKVKFLCMFISAILFSKSLRRFEKK
jgi:hypothetical protein